MIVYANSFVSFTTLPYLDKRFCVPKRATGFYLGEVILKLTAVLKIMHWERNMQVIISAFMFFMAR